MSRKVFMNLEAALDYLALEDIDADLAVIPPDVDDLTDEDELNDEDTEAPLVRDVPGLVEVINADEEDGSDMPCTSADPKPPTKKQRKETPKVAWKKKNPIYSKWSDIDDTEPVKLENLEACLHDLTPLQIFEKFFSPEVYQLIVDETVRYAVTQKNKPRFTVSSEEIKVFIGFLLFSGYHTLPSERDYWSEEKDLGVDIVRNAFSRNAYLTLKSVIHFQDNSQAQGYKDDKAFKIKPLMNLLNKNFQQWEIFEKNLSIDEMIVRYYGHHSLKQFIRAKPIRFGYKLWAMCGESGYCFNFSLYCGKKTNDSEATGPLGSRVVMQMLSIVDNPSFHAVYFDNFFTSHSLLVQLREKGFRATGTVRDARTANCPLKPAKEMDKMKRGTYDYRFDTENEIFAVRWKDNKSVALASNFDWIEPLATAKRWSKELKEKVSIPQPLMIKNYNQYMGGVDHHDWLLEKHHIAIRGKKWYWCLVTRMIDMAVVNACIIYRLIHGPNSISTKDFRRAVAVSYLLKGHGKRVMQGRPLSYPFTSKTPINADVRYDGQDHVIAKREKQRRCQLKGCNGRPLTYCMKCNITLCTGCFSNYHKKV